MSEENHSVLTEADTPTELDTLMSNLRAAGAERYDAAGWRYLEALSRRTQGQQGSARRMLDAKLAQALAAFKERFDCARRDAEETVALNAQQYPHAAKDLQQRLDAGDFKGLHQLISSLKAKEQCASLGALVKQLEQHTPTNADTRPQANAGARFELKAIRHFRSTWAKLSVGKQVAQALGQAPKNAGPINSHMLVLRSLALMREVSPDYLNRFMSYADTLLSLEQCEKEPPAPPKKTQTAKAVKK